MPQNSGQKMWSLIYEARRSCFNELYFPFVLCDFPRKGKRRSSAVPLPSSFAFIQMTVFIKTISKYTENIHAQLKSSYFEAFSATGSANYLKVQSHQCLAYPALWITVPISSH